MNVSRENIDALNALLTMKIEKADYETNVNNTLKDYRRKAQVPGFRPGMVPAGMVQKMYGRSILVDEVFKQMSEGINKYIQENQLRTLGEPIPSEKSNPIDFDTQTEFEFKYDLALAPEVKLELNNKIKLPYYHIEVTEEEKQKRIDSHLRYYGKMVTADSIGLDDLVIVDLSQDKEGGLNVADATLGMKVIPEAKQKKLEGLKVGDAIELDIRKMLTSDADCAAFLKIAKEELAKVDPQFKLVIKEVRRLEPAAIDQALFDKVYGPGLVTSETDFKARVEADIRKQLSDESDYRFLLDTRKKLVDLAKLELPEAFLKRWLLMTSEGKLNTEQIEKEFPLFAEDLRWQLIEESIMKTQNLEVTDEDLIAFAKKMAQQQLAMYGLANMPDDNWTTYAKNILENKTERKRIHERAVEVKVIDYVKTAVKLDNKEVSGEQFNKLFEKEAE
ncbi:MAG: trigger factor [Prevotellaceae bacterium]|jgi:trigger factor|nr:trigger factor [Prevotellaceae bacterium]